MVGPPKPKGIAMSHVQSPIDRPARCTKAELSVQVETLKRRVAVLEEAAVDRIRVEDALRMSEARLRAIMNHAPAEIFLVDREGRYVLVNGEFELDHMQPMASGDGTVHVRLKAVRTILAAAAFTECRAR